jgi:hypothetical protein
MTLQEKCVNMVINAVHQLEDVKDGCKAKETTEKKSKDQFRHPIYIIIFVFSVHDEDK